MLKDPLKELMINAGVTGYMHGHNHAIQAYQSADTGQLVFSSGSSVHLPDYGAMYFDVYKDYILSFWMPAEGPARPLGIFDLKKITSTVSSRKTVFKAPP